MSFAGTIVGDGPVIARDGDDELAWGDGVLSAQQSYSVTVDGMLRDPKMVARKVADMRRALDISRGLFPSGPVTHRMVDTPGRVWHWARDIAGREGHPAMRRRWFHKPEHRLRPTSAFTVDDLKRQIRREQRTVPVSPILLGTRTCRFYPVGPIRDGFIEVRPADGDVIEVPVLKGPPEWRLADEADTGPIICPR